MNFESIKTVSKKWGISDSRIRKLCGLGRIEGAKKEDGFWKIPKETIKPFDKRFAQQYKELFSKIDTYKKTMDKWIKVNPSLTELEQKRWRENFIIENTYNSNAIEGNTMSLQQTAWVLEGITIDKKPLKEHLELVGHKEAFEWLESIAKENLPITEDFIKKIHSLVLMDRKQDAGVYRMIPVKITGALHVPPQPFLIEPQIQKLLKKYKDLKKNKHIIECIARFHIMFEEIHPFIDGNGRTGRLLINYELIKNKYLPIDIKYKDSKKYYEAFNEYHKDGKKDISAMVKLISEYLIETYEQFRKLIVNKKFNIILKLPKQLDPF